MTTDLIWEKILKCLVIFEAALEAALIRGEIRSKDEIEEKKSEIKGGKYLLKNPQGKVYSRIQLDRVNELKDPETLSKTIEATKPKPDIPPEELLAQEQAEKEQTIKKQEEERKVFLNTLKEKGIKRWDYKSIRLDYKGRGITQEINLLDIDGERVRSWTDNFSSKEVPTLPELFAKLGDDGWEMISHVVNQDITQNGVTLHYYNFKREKLWKTIS